MKTLQLINDGTFSQGFYLQPVSNGCGCILDFGLPDRQTYSWKIAQHFSRYDMTRSGTFAANPDGSRVYQNPGKRVTLTQEGSSVITLEVLGSAEYLHPRRLGEPWPHLLIEQDMTSDYIDRYISLPFSMSLRNDYLRNCMGTENDPDLHCYQVSLFFVMQNRDPLSPGFGDFFWFGIPGYDSRFDVRDCYIAMDSGKDDASGKLIYCLGGAEWYSAHYDTDPKSGRWATVKADLLPFIREALTEAHKRGFMMKTSFKDLQFRSMNLGAEVPGTFDGAVSLKDLSLQGILHEQ